MRIERRRVGRAVHRRTATKIVGGRPQRKNNWEPTPNAYWGLPQITIERERPGSGYRHLLTKRDVVRFVALLPDWDELSEELTTIVLAPGERNTAGWSDVGVVAVCAWPRKLWQSVHSEFFDAHKGDREVAAQCVRLAEKRASYGLVLEAVRGSRSALELVSKLTK